MFSYIYANQHGVQHFYVHTNVKEVEKYALQIIKDLMLRFSRAQREDNHKLIEKAEKLINEASIEQIIPAWNELATFIFKEKMLLHSIQSFNLVE